MNLTNVKAGAKIILTEEFRFNSSPKSWQKELILPKNLVLSLVSFHVTRQGTYMIFQVLRAKPIIEKYYEGIDPKQYAGCRTIRMYSPRSECFINEAEFRDFDEEYLELTHADYKK